MRCMKFNSRQQRFTSEFPIDLNGTQSAIRAGYSPKTADRTAYKLLRKAEIQQAIRVRFAEREKRTQITQDRVVEKLWEIVLRSMQTIPVVDGRGNPLGEYTYHPGAATRALELLGRHLGMWKPIGSEEDPLTIQLRTVQDFDFSQLTDEELREVASHGQAIRTRLALPSPGDSSG